MTVNMQAVKSLAEGKVIEVRFDATQQPEGYFKVLEEALGLPVRRMKTLDPSNTIWWAWLDRREP